jgi:dolichyl-phosphate-mannose--protein O-mannosyl transferase
MLQAGLNENWSHPPLAKMLIGTGMALFGDNAFGWRVTGVVFGALTLAFLFVLGRILFDSAVAGAVAALFGLLNQIHYVQARIATLDVYMVAFMFAGLAAFVCVFKTGSSLKSRFIALASAGALLGLAAACKWSGGVPLLAGVVLLWARRAELFPAPRLIAMALSGFAAAVVFGYLAANLSLLHMIHPAYAPPLSDEAPAAPSATPAAKPEYSSLRELVELQEDMLRAHLNLRVETQPNESGWLSWPLMLRPIWYYHHDAPEGRRGRVSGILCVGNPLIFWAGALALLVCLWDWVKRRPIESEFILIQFIFAWMIWAVLPRHVEFFFYYYPAAMLLGLALVRAARILRVPRPAAAGFIALAAAVFLFYKPILSNKAVRRPAMERRMLFPAWRWPLHRR